MSAFVRHFYSSVDGFFDYEALYCEAAAHVPDGGIAVEVGVWRGKSLAFLSVEFANRAKSNVSLIGVDLFGDTQDMGHPAFAPGIIAAMMRRGGGVIPRLVQGVSWEVASQFEDDSIDFVFIDGAHDFNSVMQDITAWWPKVKQGGMMAGHDYTHHHPDVMRAVGTYYERECIDVVGSCWRIMKPEAGPLTAPRRDV